MITSIMGELTSCAFGNPHSRNPSSAKSTQEVDLARSLVLQHFNADPEQYYVIFTKYVAVVRANVEMSQGF
jgi:selenocysteine lyase/cysteine desulfurase